MLRNVAPPAMANSVLFAKIQSVRVKHSSLDYSAKGRLPETKQQIVEMILNGSGIRDTERVLEISPTTVINELKKGPELQAVNHDFLAIHRHDQIVVDIVKVEDNSDVSRQDTSVEMDEMWSYIGCKDNQRWLWHAVDRITGKVLAYVLGRRRDEVFLKSKDLLEPFRDHPFLYR